MGCGVPALVLAGSYAWLALEHGTLGLWNVVVHESGRYTLGETVLYYGHFLREIPTVVAFVLFLLGSSGAVGPGSSGTVEGGGPGSRGLRPGMGWAALALAGTLVGVALLRTATVQGWESALLDLAQYRTRDDLVGFGTHWRYHWLSTLWFGAVAGLAPGLTKRLSGIPALAVHRPWMAAGWGYVLVLTLVFGLSGDVFLDARYAGHQAREILTHGPVTLLLGLGTVALAGLRGSRGLQRPPSSPPRGSTATFTALALAVPVHLAVVTLAGGVMEHGQSEHGLAAMVAAHYFEHSLDYLLVFLLLVACLALVNLQPVPSTAAPTPRREDPDHARH